MRVPEQSDCHVPPLRRSSHGSRNSLEATDLTPAGCLDSCRGVDISLPPKLWPVTSLDGVEAGDFHEPLAAFRHRVQVAVEVKDLNAIAGRGQERLKERVRVNDHAQRPINHIMRALKVAPLWSTDD